MKYIMELLKEKPLGEQKAYLEKHRNFLSTQIGQITMEISDIEKKMQAKLIQDQLDIHAAESKNLNKKPKRGQIITFTEYDDIMYDLKDYPDIIISIQNHFNIDSISELLQSDLQWVKNKIRNIKKQHENR